MSLEAGARTGRPLPAYAYRLGRSPHPRRHPAGHAYGAPEPRPDAFDPGRWREARDWLYALDLFEAGYYFEAHEWLEAFWIAFGRRTPEGRLARALVQLAAAQLQRERGSGAAGRMAERGARALAPLPSTVLGVCTDVLARRARAWARGTSGSLRVPLAGAGDPRPGLTGPDSRV